MRGDTRDTRGRKEKMEITSRSTYAPCSRVPRCIRHCRTLYIRRRILEYNAIHETSRAARCKKSYLRNGATCNKRLRESSIFLAIPIASGPLHRCGYDSIGKLGPLVEEMLFRELLNRYKIQGKVGQRKRGL